MIRHSALIRALQKKDRKRFNRLLSFFCLFFLGYLCFYNFDARHLLGGFGIFKCIRAIYFIYNEYAFILGIHVSVTGDNKLTSVVGHIVDRNRHSLLVKNKLYRMHFLADLHFSYVALGATTAFESAVAQSKQKKTLVECRGTRVFTCGEDTHSLRLKSKLFDLQSGYAHPLLRLAQQLRLKPRLRNQNKKRHSLSVFFCFVQRLRKRYFLRFAIRFRTPTVFYTND